MRADALGLAKQASPARGNQLIQNSYDALDREISHLVPQPTGPAITTSTSYDPAGRVNAKSDTAGHSLTYAFDTAKRPTSVTQAAPTFAGTRVVGYLLDLAGNKTRTTWAEEIRRIRGHDTYSPSSETYPPGPTA